jgi:hypothetical protein
MFPFGSQPPSGFNTRAVHQSQEGINIGFVNIPIPFTVTQGCDIFKVPVIVKRNFGKFKICIIVKSHQILPLHKGDGYNHFRIDVCIAIQCLFQTVLDVPGFEGIQFNEKIGIKCGTGTH